MDAYFKKTFRNFYTFLFLIFLSVSVIALDFYHQKLNNIRSFITDLVIYPISYISTVPKNLLEISLVETQIKDDMKSEIQKLKEENIKLKIQLQEYQAIKDENLRLRKIQKQVKKVDEKQLIVKVLNNNIHPTKQMVSIDRGKKDGLFIGQNVLGLKGLIGQIVEISALSSKVILVSDLNHNVPAQITRTGEKVIVKGKNKNNELELIFVPTNTDIKIGDSISTSGMAGRFKANIPIGIVKDVVNEKEKKFMRVSVKPLESIGNASELILIWNTQDKVNKENDITKKTDE
ncbi:MAG: rod shape-determining protein MreC [Gammaproteobacteria bacterium]|nr:rod shape-determining protein MreC [Gammaproteobacteria bacterium]|tara:strand:- start:162523 stop:163392 length:870 start_codon:yes stop_codon:yes gene_type:complete